MVDPTTIAIEDTLNSAERCRIASMWCESALHEHASIASFGDFLRDAMLVGAPPTILLRIIRAMEDELRHAQICFTIARAFSGEAKGPGDFAKLAAVKRRESIEEILSAVIVEGCIGETIACAYIKAAADHAASPALADQLREIAADEAEHSVLAWDFVGWVLTRHPEHTVFCKSIFERALDAPQKIMQHPKFCESASRYGHLDVRERLTIRRQCLDGEIRPKFERLFLGAFASHG